MNMRGQESTIKEVKPSLDYRDTLWPRSRGGVIGSRTGFKHQGLRACGFESRSRHQKEANDDNEEEGQGSQ